MSTMFETRNDLDSSFIQETFRESEGHNNLRNKNEFIQQRVRLVGNGPQSSFLTESSFFTADKESSFELLVYQLIIGWPRSYKTSFTRVDLNEVLPF